MKIAIGVFAHNEERDLPVLLADLLAQQEVTNALCFVLCNGCTDGSVDVARQAIATASTPFPIEILDLPVGSKSNTWNLFVEASSKQGCDVAVFVDADIRIHDVLAISRLLEELNDSEASAVVSKPTPVFSQNTPRWLRTAFVGAGTRHNDGAICGQLYAAKMSRIGELRLPVPCLVEDGFLAACLVTNLLSGEGDQLRVQASKRVAHSFEPPQSLHEFFTHSVRMAVGTEMNAALFTPLWMATSAEERLDLLRSFGSKTEVERWLTHHETLPHNSALQIAHVAKKLRHSIRSRGLKATLVLPLLLGRAIYETRVNSIARRAIKRREFRW